MIISGVQCGGGGVRRSRAFLVTKCQGFIGRNFGKVLVYDCHDKNTNAGPSIPVLVLGFWITPFIMRRRHAIPPVIPGLNMIYAFQAKPTKKV